MRALIHALMHTRNLMPIGILSIAVRVEEGVKAFALSNVAQEVQNNVVNVNYSH